MRKVIMGLLALLLALPAAVSASVWQGTVETAETSNVRAGAEGIVETLPLRVGEYVTAATESVVIRESRVFAPFDGRISGIGTHAELLESNEIYRDVYESQTGAGNGDFDRPEADDAADDRASGKEVE